MTPQRGIWLGAEYFSPVPPNAGAKTVAWIMATTAAFLLVVLHSGEQAHAATPAQARYYACLKYRVAVLDDLESDASTIVRKVDEACTPDMAAAMKERFPSIPLDEHVRRVRKLNAKARNNGPALDSVNTWRAFCLRHSPERIQAVRDLWRAKYQSK